MFEQTAFFSVWYWLLTAVFWSMFSYFTFGVPFDVIRRAGRRGGEDAELCDRMARRNLKRINEGVERYGVVAAAISGFMFSALTVFAFLLNSEVAQGLFFLMIPAAIGGLFALNNGRKLMARDLDAEAMRAALLRQRRFNQFVGFVAIVLCAVFFALKYSDRLQFVYG